MIIQAGGLLFVPLQEDRFYDFFGSLGFILTNIASLYVGGNDPRTLSLWPNLGTRRLLLNGVLSTWAVRLGSFLLSVCGCHAIKLML